MKTLYILDDPGRDKHFHHYALAGLEEAGFSPLVVYFSGSTKMSRLAELGHEVTSLNLTRSLYKNFNPLPVFRLARLIKKTKAGILHVQRHRPLIYAGIACRITGRPMIYTIRQVRLIRNTNRRLAFRLVTPALARIISVSSGSREDFLSRTDYPPEKISVVFNGIDLKPYEINIEKNEARRRLSLPSDLFIFGMAAGFRKAKDHIGLIRAFHSIKERLGKSIMVFAGSGAEEQAIQKEIKNLSLENRVILTGRLNPEKIPVFLKALDCFVHASFREGMPAAVLEAMAARLPVIATDAEGVPDIFDTSETFGRMTPKGDITALAQAMAELYHAEPGERKTMGENAAKRLKEGFTRRHTAEGIVNVYNDVLVGK